MIDKITESRYKAILDQMMNFLHHGTGEGVGRYNRTSVYSNDVLLSITPNDIVEWMKFKAYGGNFADGAQPTGARSNSLSFYKKAISHYMPNTLHQWNEVRNEGNPTRSVAVNAFIKFIKKKEARNEGAESCVRRPMSETEFELLHTVLRQEASGGGSWVIWRFGMPALINLQFHMIARIDDTTQIILNHIRLHDHYKEALKTKLNWSKNVLDERDAPWQVVLGSCSAKFCVYISLGIWLEMNLRYNVYAEESPFVFAFTPDCTSPGGGKKSKVIAQRIFGQGVFRRPEFMVLDEETDKVGQLGSHRIRKSAATRMR